MSTWLHCGDVNGARVEFTVHMEGGSSGSGRMREERRKVRNKL